MKTPAAALLLLTLSPAQVPAAISSLGIPSVDRQAAVSYNQWLASSFVASGEASAVWVDSITVKLACAAPNRHVFLAITGTASGRPDMNDIRVVADAAPLTSPVQLSSVITVTMQPREENGPAVLSPGQQYWVVFGVTQPDWDEALPSGLFHWSYAASNAGMTSQDGWSITTATATGNTAGQNWSTELSTPYSFSLVLTPVPEPGVLPFVLSGLVLLWSRRFRS